MRRGRQKRATSRCKLWWLAGRANAAICNCGDLRRDNCPPAPDDSTLTDQWSQATARIAQEFSNSPCTGEDPLTTEGLSHSDKLLSS